MARRRRARRNPTGLDWMLILGGGAAVGFTVYYMTKQADVAKVAAAAKAAGQSPQLTA